MTMIRGENYASFYLHSHIHLLAIQFLKTVLFCGYTHNIRVCCMLTIVWSIATG